MSYDLILIAVPLIVTYILSYALYRKNVINKDFHARIWNILIFFSFLVSVGMGIIMTVFMNFGLTVPSSFDFNYWHGEVGIAFFVILLFHLHWNWSSFKRYFK
jgi:hypothetical protein